MSVEFRDQLLSVQKYKTAKNTNDDILSIHLENNTKDTSQKKMEEMKNLNLLKYIFYLSAEPEFE